MTVSTSMSVNRTRWLVAALLVKSALLRSRLSLRAYNPGQLRVPAGNPDGGQWTREDGGGSRTDRDDGRLIVVSDEGDRRLTVLLAEEEVRGGHTLRDHVGKTDEDLLDRVRSSRTISTFYAYGRQRHGSFESAESANDLVNRTLERHALEVDMVASGKSDDAFLKERFGYKTGREAYTDGYIEPHARNTYGVGVLIYHDPSSSRGYRVYTAYPRNDGD